MKNGLWQVKGLPADLPRKYTVDADRFDKKTQTWRPVKLRRRNRATIISPEFCVPDAVREFLELAKKSGYHSLRVIGPKLD